MYWKHFGGHILFWVIIMLTYALSEWGYRDNFGQAILFEGLFLPVRLVAVYVNWWLLIPGLLYRHFIGRYLFLLLVLLFLLAAVQRYFVLYWAYPVFFPEWMPEGQAVDVWVFFRVVQNVVIIASPVAFSTAIKIFLDWYAEKNRARQLAIEKREAELNYLKSQINPHFLFNTLNNLYGLSKEGSEKVPALIVKLSDLLHYSLYESAAEKIEVGQELKLIEDFVILECERYEDRIMLDWKVDHTLLDYKIAPLLLIPLVENAFKHGVREELKQTKIELALAKEAHWLVFSVVNSIPAHFQHPDTPGIGLKNLRRRLELLYPDAFQLVLEEQQQLHRVVLKVRV